MIYKDSLDQVLEEEREALMKKWDIGAAACRWLIECNCWCDTDNNLKHHTDDTDDCWCDTDYSDDHHYLLKLHTSYSLFFLSWILIIITIIIIYHHYLLHLHLCRYALNSSIPPTEVVDPRHINTKTGNFGVVILDLQYHWSIMMRMMMMMMMMFCCFFYYVNIV